MIDAQMKMSSKKVRKKERSIWIVFKLCFCSIRERLCYHGCVYSIKGHYDHLQHRYFIFELFLHSTKIKCRTRVEHLLNCPLMAKGGVSRFSSTSQVYIIFFPPIQYVYAPKYTHTHLYVCMCPCNQALTFICM